MVSVALILLPCPAVTEVFQRGSNYLPIVRWPATYPPLAAKNKINGFCTMQFDVDVQGNVENERVIECNPEGYFENQSIQAVSRFQYQPFGFRVVGVIDIFWFSSDIDSERSHYKYLGIGIRLMCDETSRKCRAELAAQ